jgi:hypothetical protein
LVEDRHETTSAAVGDEAISAFRRLAIEFR